MCGRFTQLLSWAELVDLYRITEPKPAPNLPVRYNLAPTEDVSVIRPGAAGGRALARMRWGLVPSWAKDIKVGARMINARVETLASKPAFREALQRRRCLIPADGFFEWRSGDKPPRQPFYITAAAGGPLTFAGLWENWRSPDGDWLKSCTIVTTAATSEVAWLHDRMPVMLAASAFDAWLDVGSVESAKAQAILAGNPSPALHIEAVSKRVNNVRNDDADCIAPAAEPSLL